uniref:Reverse transcriptase domain-containing protein n=1 Tax=Pygocentrus nattereri TaxID=42514 RepID=A0AAR2KCA8_PYGNA
MARLILLLLEFGSYSGYKLNFSKSTFYPINAAACTITQTEIPFRLAPDGFKYLGVNITRKISLIQDANFSPLLTKMCSDLQRWSNLPLSLVGRVQCIKMNVLPKFSFLFQCLPIFLPKSFFVSIDKTVTGFIWGGRVPRIRKGILQCPRSSGGLALPNFMYYYFAANIQKMAFWFKNPEAAWCIMESLSCHSSSIRALVYSSLPILSSHFSSNPLVVSTLKIWTQFSKMFHFTEASVLSPICKNHLFNPKPPPPFFLFIYLFYINVSLISFLYFPFILFYLHIDSRL